MFFAGLLDLIRSLVDLMGAIIETHESRRRDTCHPRHLAPRRGGTTPKKRPARCGVTGFCAGARDGRVALQGTPAELEATSGRYRRLVASSSGCRRTGYGRTWMAGVASRVCRLSSLT